MYPSGFSVPCTEAEKCGVDLPLDEAWHALLYNMHLWDDKYDLVAGQPGCVYDPSSYVIGLIMPKYCIWPI